MKVLINKLWLYCLNVLSLFYLFLIQNFCLWSQLAPSHCQLSWSQGSDAMSLYSFFCQLSNQYEGRLEACTKIPHFLIDWMLRSFKLLKFLWQIKPQVWRPSLKLVSGQSELMYDLCLALIERVSRPRVWSVREMSTHLKLLNLQSIRKWVSYINSWTYMLIICL